ncbi:MAG: amidophosphoribosyltransferase [Alphaproteobacteria bacterium]|jgi:amidophosphoribosyltransferase|nr:amidophosphoribosyltransferase [Alphaproteobacteria bacterium]MDP6517751.1 amidophosphoribosyltransferase [Alphaproteobacteria bacterium]
MLMTHPFEDDKLHEECGIFGLFGHPDAGTLTTLGLHALQHRGQEAAGIVSFDGAHFHSHRSLGQVGDNFSDASVIDLLTGSAALGHVRYSTTGDTILRNVQPLFADLAGGGLAVAHNGNLTNGTQLRKRLEGQGSIFQSTTDTEVIVHLIATGTKGNFVDRLVDALFQVHGAYALVLLTNDALVGARDPMGVRPLVLGQLDGAHILASESCALDIIGARLVRNIEPGEVVVIDDAGCHSLKPFPSSSAPRFCVFEYIYFSRPDSIVEGVNIYDARKRIGAELARESGLPADVVVPVPDSGVPAAIGYAVEAGIPFELGIIRNHYVGRTFIEPTDSIRHLGVKLKHNANRTSLAGKRVVLVDDSIVRGTTSTKIVTMVREAGAREVHMRVASPPITQSCFYGVDTPHRDQLLAATRGIEEMARHIGVDTLAFISNDGLYQAMGKGARNAARPQYCDACFTGNYPIELTDLHGGGAPAQLSLLAESA